MVNKRYHTGIFIYMNNTPIIWFIKQKNTVELSIFGSKLIALMVAIKMVDTLRYKLNIVAITIDGLAAFFVIIKRWLRIH